MGIGLRIKELRKRARITQPELAEKIGVHETTIRRWELEKDRGPDSKAVIALAKELSTTPEYLLNGDKEGTEDNKSVSYIKEQSKNRGMAVYFARNGERFEVPANSEGYAFLREMASRDIKTSMPLAVGAN